MVASHADVVEAGVLTRNRGNRLLLDRGQLNDYEAKILNGWSSWQPSKRCYPGIKVAFLHRHSVSHSPFASFDSTQSLQQHSPLYTRPSNL